MKVKIISEKNNPLLKRKELMVKVDYEGSATPTRSALEKEISKLTNAPVEKVEISKIISEIGKAEGSAWVKLLENPEDKFVKKKETPKEEAPKETLEQSSAAAPREEEKPKEEKPAEEKKEEPKEELKEESKEEKPAEEKKEEPKEEKPAKEGKSE